MSEIRFVYSWHKSRERAEMALEHCFATGDIVEGERPKIERRKSFWVITLPECLSA